MAINPVAADELGEDGPVDTPRRAQIDVLHAGILAESGQLEARGEAPGVAFRSFPVAIRMMSNRPTAFLTANILST